LEVRKNWRQQAREVQQAGLNPCVTSSWHLPLFFHTSRSARLSHWKTTKRPGKDGSAHRLPLSCLPKFDEFQPPNALHTAKIHGMERRPREFVADFKLAAPRFFPSRRLQDFERGLVASNPLPKTFFDAVCGPFFPIALPNHANRPKKESDGSSFIWLSILHYQLGATIRPK
jgi:hypothetical protein